MAERRKRRDQSRSHTETAPQNVTDTIDLVELMYRLLGRWKLIVGLALLLAIVFGIYTSLFVTPLYEATSTIYVLSRRDSAINMSDLQIGTALTQDYIKVFQMWEVHEEVISNLSLPYTYKDIRQMLRVTNDSNTRMLDIAVTSENAQEAAAIANEYAKVSSQYIADTMATDKPSVMSVALVPSNPVSPNLSKNMVLGFLLGAVLAMGVITVQMLLDDTYKTAEDVRRYTGLVTLAMIPAIETVMQKNSGKKKMKKTGGRYA